MPTVFTTHTEDPLEIIAAAHMNNVQTAVNNVEAGWIAAPETWTYASATTFTITGDYTSYYTTGTRIKMTNSSTKYFVVVSSSYGAPTTTVTVTGGSDYALADAAISAAYYSYYVAPPGYPAMFNYTPTGPTTNATLTGRFAVIGRQCVCQIHMAASGAVTWAAMPSLPITAAAGLTTYDDGDADIAQAGGEGGYFDSGTATTLGTVYPRVGSSATAVNLTTAAGADWSATVPITWANGDAFSVRFQYEI